MLINVLNDSLVHSWRLKFGHKINFFSRLWAKVCSRFWSSGKILKLKFSHYFAADVWLRLRSWILVNIQKLGLVKIFNWDLVKILMFGWNFEVNAWSRFWRRNLIMICDWIVIWPIRLLWLDELNPWVRCAFGNVLSLQPRFMPKKNNWFISRKQISASLLHWWKDQNGVCLACTPICPVVFAS